MIDDQIITRTEAMALGLIRYFTSKPCKRGHIAERYVLRSKCIECNRERARVRYAANSEKINEQNRAYYAANWEKITKQQQTYYAANSKKISERKRTYYVANLEKIKERRRIRTRLVRVDEIDTVLTKVHLKASYEK
jgi:hypothetical protein